MIKPTLLIAIFLSIVFFACTKNEKEDIKPKHFSIDGLNDVSIGPNGIVSLPLEVKNLSDSAKYVALSLAGLPERVAVQITPDSGWATYSCTIRFTATSAIPGNYQVTLVASSGKEFNEYPFELHITDSSQFDLILGTWFLQEKGYDIDEDLQLDQGEASVGGSATLQLNPDKTGRWSTYNATYKTATLNWNLAVDESRLELMLENGSSMSNRIYRVDSLKLIILREDKSYAFGEWLIFGK